MTIGIYIIEHKSGLKYVGQSNNIEDRWRQHRKNLKLDNHHNKKLQELWNSSVETDFNFFIYEIAPKDLTALQTQRWLIKIEKSLYSQFKSQCLAINSVMPEIVDTKEAVEEYKSEMERKNRVRDKEIKELRKNLKMEIEKDELLLKAEKLKLSSLIEQVDTKRVFFKSNTGILSIFKKRNPSFNKKNEKLELHYLECEITKSRELNYKLFKELLDKKKRYKMLNKGLSKNQKYTAPLFGGRYQSFISEEH